MKKPNWKLRFQYWFDNRMANGMRSLVAILTFFTLLIVLLISACLFFFGLLGNDVSLFSAIWDTLASTVNAWLPYSEDGESGYLLLTSFGAVAGLLFTSALIGIISSAIEEKLISLRKGNSLVLEENHIVVLGFTPGEYTLISQLILAEAGKSSCIVIVDNMERDEMERLIKENVSVPKESRIVCRNANICDPNSLLICSIPTCKTVIVNVLEDDRTTKAILAVSVIMERTGPDCKDIPVVSSVSCEEALFPQYTLGKNSILMLQSHDLIARIIAHSCTQPGLSEVFLNIFNFDGSELYIRQLPGAEGKTFSELMDRTDQAVPLGILHAGTIKLNPPMAQKIFPGDSLLLFAEDGSSGSIAPADLDYHSPAKIQSLAPISISGRVVVIGCNKVLETLLQELPDSIEEVVITDVSEADREVIDSLYTFSNRRLSVFPGTLSSMEALEGLVRRADFVVLLSNYTADAETADLHTIHLLLNLRDIKHRLGLSFTITAEMRLESNHNLVAAGDPTDFIIASDIVSMILVQVAKNPMLYEVFQEILSNEGNEFYLKPATAFGCEEKEYSVRKLRLATFSRGYILLGYLKVRGNGRAIRLNPPLEETVVLSPQDSLIVLGTQ